jgi:hypothetical protein
LPAGPAAAIVRPAIREGVLPIEPGGVRLTDEQRLAWLRLIRSENVGPAGIMAQTPRPSPLRNT